ncbi:hypothetical protein D3C71_547000 [compost metagenome]
MKEFKWYEWLMLAFLSLFFVSLCALSPWGQSFLSSEAAPAWMQAIGSLLGLAIAIWVPMDQHRRSTQRAKHEDNERIQRTLMAIRDELLVRYEQYCRVVKEKLHAAKPTGFMDGYWLFAADSFPVYRSSLSTLGGVESALLRKGIIRCYALLEGLLLTIETNSKLAKLYLAELALHELEPTARSAKLVDSLREELTQYFPSILLAEETAEASLRELMPLFPGEPAVLYGDSVNCE